MSRPALLAAACLAAALAPATAGARAATRAITATWHADMGSDGRYCVRASHLEAAAMTGTRVYQRTCHSERRWQQMGVTFSRRLPGRVPMAES